MCVVPYTQALSMERRGHYIELTVVSAWNLMIARRCGSKTCTLVTFSSAENDNNHIIHIRPRGFSTHGYKIDGTTANELQRCSEQNI